MPIVFVITVELLLRPSMSITVMLILNVKLK